MHLENKIDNYLEQLFTNSCSFIELALFAFNYQYIHNPVYKEYCNRLNICSNDVKKLTEIPFLPIDFFKTHKIISSNNKTQLKFLSSGTSKVGLSRHYIIDPEIYKKSFLSSFNTFYNPPDEYVILALLPSYLERGNSSLVYMVDDLIKQSGKNDSGFYLNNFSELSSKISQLENNKTNYILFGVSFALIDFAAKFPIPMNHGLIIETGGMKGMRKEITRSELHKTLSESFGLRNIHSEYGMTELLSQAYSKHDGVFYCPSTMNVLVRDATDPLLVEPYGKGALNIIDLSNIYSCSFIATNDLGEVYSDGGFSVQGRFDDAEVRGCNLMIG